MSNTSFFYFFLNAKINKLYSHSSHTCAYFFFQNHSVIQIFYVILIKHNIMRKLGFCLRENKDTDQLFSNRTAVLRVWFCYTDSTLPLLKSRDLSSFQIFSVTAQACCVRDIFCDCTGIFVSDLVRYIILYYT